MLFMQCQISNYNSTQSISAEWYNDFNWRRTYRRVHYSTNVKEYFSTAVELRFVGPIMWPNRIAVRGRFQWMLILRIFKSHLRLGAGPGENKEWNLNNALDSSMSTSRKGSNAPYHWYMIGLNDLKLICLMSMRLFDLFIFWFRLKHQKRKFGKFMGT